MNSMEKRKQIRFNIKKLSFWMHPFERLISETIRARSNLFEIHMHPINGNQKQKIEEGNNTMTKRQKNKQ
jgi:hypothetical protein